MPIRRAKKPVAGTRDTGNGTTSSKIRPLWWGPEAVLQRLQNGEYVGEICRLASIEMGQLGMPMVPPTLRSDIAKWAESASWGGQFKQALAMYTFDGKSQMIMSKDWHDEFFHAMEECGGKAEDACVACGVGYGVILALTDRRNKCYDKKFHERFRIAEGDRIGGIRAQFLQYAENPDNDEKTRLKVQQVVLETHVPTLHGSNKEIHVSGDVEHKHQHGFEVMLATEVVMASQARVRALQQGRQNALRVGRERNEVIDVTPVTVRERVPV